MANLLVIARDSSLIADDAINTLKTRLGDGEVKHISELPMPGDDYIEAAVNGVSDAQIILIFLEEDAPLDWVGDMDDADGAALAAALEQGKRVVAVLIGDAQIKADAPESIASLKRRAPIRLKIGEANTFADTLVSAFKLESAPPVSAAPLPTAPAVPPAPAAPVPTAPPAPAAFAPDRIGAALGRFAKNVFGFGARHWRILRAGLLGMAGLGCLAVLGAGVIRLAEDHQRETDRADRATSTALTATRFTSDRQETATAQSATAVAQAATATSGAIATATQRWIMEPNIDVMSRFGASIGFEEANCRGNSAFRIDYGYRHQNMFISLRYIVPSFSSTKEWYVGIRFRGNHRMFIGRNGVWFHRDPTDNDIPYGTSTNLHTGAGQSNKIDLFVIEDRVSFYVNDTLERTFKLQDTPTREGFHMLCGVFSSSDSFTLNYRVDVWRP